MVRRADKDLMKEITPENLRNRGDKPGTLELTRKASGMSRKELAMVLGVNELTIFRLEKGTTRPKEDFINKLCALAIIRPEGRQLKRYEAGKFTPIGVAAGLAALARTSVFGKVAAAALGGLAVGVLPTLRVLPAAGFLSYGVIRAIKALCSDKSGLECQEIDDRFEIRRRERK